MPKFNSYNTAVPCMSSTYITIFHTCTGHKSVSTCTLCMHNMTTHVRTQLVSLCRINTLMIADWVWNWALPNETQCAVQDLKSVCVHYIMLYFPSWNNLALGKTFGGVFENSLSFFLRLVLRPKRPSFLCQSPDLGLMPSQRASPALRSFVLGLKRTGLPSTAVHSLLTMISCCDGRRTSVDQRLRNWIMLTNIWELFLSQLFTRNIHVYIWLPRKLRNDYFSSFKIYD